MFFFTSKAHNCCLSETHLVGLTASATRPARLAIGCYAILPPVRCHNTSLLTTEYVTPARLQGEREGKGEGREESPCIFWLPGPQKMEGKRIRGGYDDALYKCAI